MRPEKEKKTDHGQQYPYPEYAAGKSGFPGMFYNAVEITPSTKTQESKIGTVDTSHDSGNHGHCCMR